MKFCLCECHKLSTENVKGYYQGCKCGENNCLTPYMADKILEDIESRLKSLEKHSNMEQLKYIVQERAQTRALILRCDDNYKNLEERLSDLEKWTRKDEDRIYAILKDHEKEIEELKLFRDIIREQYKNKKTPHKCPSCDGKRYIQSKELPIAAPCLVCEEKGIIWG